MPARLAAPAIIHVNPSGDDRGSGTRDGPVATIAGALRALRGLTAGQRRHGVEIRFADGCYTLARPIHLTRADSGSPHAPVVWRPEPGAQVTLSGGRRLSGFSAGTVDGTPCWTLDLPEVAAGTWYFHQLWNGARRLERPRLPESGSFRFAGFDGAPDTGFQWGKGPERAEYHPGDLQRFANLGDVKLVALQLWFECHLRLAGLDESRRVVSFACRSTGSLRDELGKPARYWVENVREGLKRPGQWYLDRREGRLYYLPRAGEDPATTELIAPRLPELLRFGAVVHDVRFEGLTLAHCDWEREATQQSPVQAAHDVPGAVVFAGAERCVLYGCRIAHVGGYGVQMQPPSHGNTVACCAIHDLGGGGVRIDDEVARIGHQPCVSVDPDQHVPRGGRIPPIAATIADCSIHHGGLRYPSAIGILIKDSGGNRVQYNEIHGFHYTGISCGWTWGYARSRTVDNRIERNHIHHINDQRMLSDNGGIYTLGRQPGGVIAGNHVHDIACYGYGGWGIYPDEGSSELVIDRNLVTRTAAAGLSMHYGRAVLVTRNAFLLAADGHANLSREESHRSMTFDRNVWLIAEGALQAAVLADRTRCWWKRNLIHDRRGEAQCQGRAITSLSRRDQHRGLLVCDPGYLDAEGGDLRLVPGAAALALGTQAGVRQRGAPIMPWARYRLPAAAAKPVAETVLSLLRRPESGPARIRLTVENRGALPLRGRIRLVATDARLLGTDTVRIDLRPGQLVRHDMEVELAPGVREAAIETRPVGAGLMPHLLIISGRLDVQVPLLGPCSDPRAMADALAGLPAMSLDRPAGGGTAGSVRLGLCGDQLAVSTTVVDAAPRRGHEFAWEGSAVEVFTFPVAEGPRGQVILLPAIAGNAAEARAISGQAAPEPAREVAISSAPVADGWRIDALIPLASLQLQRDQPFLIEVKANGFTAAGVRVRSSWLHAGQPWAGRDGMGLVVPIRIPGLSEVLHGHDDR